MNVCERNNVRILGDEADGVPTLMLAHGFGCDQNMWRLVTAPLSQRYRIVLFDHVGSGRSDPSAWDADRYTRLDSYARDILDIVDQLELRDVVFVGHSVAAMMGVLAAWPRPEAFTKLVLVAPSPRYIDDGNNRGGFSRADIDDLLDSLDSNYLGWSQAIAPTIMGAQDRPELAASLNTLNAVLNQRHGGESPRLTTVIVGTLRPNDRGIEVHLASGGHPPAFRLAADGVVDEVSTMGGQAVGIIGDPKFVDASVQLSPGDTLLLYTDGLTEARIGSGRDRFDDAGGLLDFAGRLAPTSPSQLIAALGGLLDELGDGVEDDVALLAIGANRQSRTKYGGGGGI